ncbi:MAG: hypothetical protein KF752_05960 [Pirellulaceae bacterium]|nr:hypothetical protein [Pirellulaceae bacterium]
MTIQLDQPLVIEISGADAGRIVHNLTSNQVQSLSIGQAVETFVTDARGWVVAHGLILHHEPHRWWLLGQHPDAARVANHIDRYIIREDARVVDHSLHSSLRLLIDDDSARVNQPIGGDIYASVVAAIPAFGPTARLCASVRSSDIDDIQSTRPLDISSESVPAADIELWGSLRIERFWPRMGHDIWDKCIPQEIDRTRQAISFTKGCYLGQETIARLDALGQIQKKLSLLKVDSTEVQPQMPVLQGEQQVGHITSVAGRDDHCLALAVLRRGYFDIGTQLICNNCPSIVLPQPADECLK